MVKVNYEPEFRTEGLCDKGPFVQGIFVSDRDKYKLKSDVYLTIFSPWTVLEVNLIYLVYPFIPLLPFSTHGVSLQELKW